MYAVVVDSGIYDEHTREYFGVYDNIELAMKGLEIASGVHNHRLDDVFLVTFKINTHNFSEELVEI